MSRWGLIADVHLGNHRILGGPTEAGVNLRCRLTGQALERALRAAREAGCQRVAILGDLFDCAKPSPEVVGVAARTFAAVEPPIGFSGGWIYIIPGNHDCSSDEPGNHALAALCRTQNCRVVDEPTYLEDGVILAPFSPRSPVEYFQEVLAAHSSLEPAFLLGHVGIVGDSTPIFMREGGNKITVEQVFELGLQAPKNTDLRVFAAGDFHKHEIHEGVLGAVNIVQVGALCQADFGDPPEVGKLCVLDTDKGGIVEVIDIPGPRFIRQSADEFMEWPIGAAEDQFPGCDLFFRIACDTRYPEQQRAVEAVLSNPAQPHVKGWQIEPVMSAAQQSEVVEAVRGAVQVGEALREWAAAQPEPEAVRERAVQIAEEFLR